MVSPLPSHMRYTNTYWMEGCGNMCVCLCVNRIYSNIQRVVESDRAWRRERGREKHWLLSSVSSGGLDLAEAKPSDAGLENCVRGVGGVTGRGSGKDCWKDSFFPHINAVLITCVHMETHTHKHMHAHTHTHTHTHSHAPPFLHSFSPPLIPLLPTISLNRLHLPSLPSPLTRCAAVRLCGVDKPKIADLGGRWCNDDECCAAASPPLRGPSTLNSCPNEMNTNTVPCLWGGVAKSKKTLQEFI